jgi:hypothetical protein
LGLLTQGRPWSGSFDPTQGSVGRGNRQKPGSHVEVVSVAEAGWTKPCLLKGGQARAALVRLQHTIEYGDTALGHCHNWPPSCARLATCSQHSLPQHESWPVGLSEIHPELVGACLQGESPAAWALTHVLSCCPWVNLPLAAVSWLLAQAPGLGTGRISKAVLAAAVV